MSRKNRILFTDKQAEKFVRKTLKGGVNRKERQLLAFHLLAVNFLSYHFDTAKFDDSVVSNLRSLLKDQFNAGVLSTRKAKRRK